MKECFEFRIDYDNKGVIGSHGSLDFCCDQIKAWKITLEIKDKKIKLVTINPHYYCWRLKEKQ